MTRKIYNIYCDESCHLQADKSKVMAWGAVWCEKDKAKEFSDKIRSIKQKHKISKNFEIKWSKISPAKIEFYKDIVKFFFNESAMYFRGLYSLDKEKLDHIRFSQNHNDFYYKMYYILLDWVIQSVHSYNIYLDIKDTRGGSKTRELQKYLANRNFDSSFECIRKTQQIRSHESEILQITDLFLGALTYKARDIKTSVAKNEIIELIESFLPTENICSKSTYHYRKFNIFIWEARCIDSLI
ncbi:MAG: DUF3800 domain-containing protein [Pseudomonadota bacterium]